MKWTEHDSARAYKEGWKLVNGYVRPHYGLATTVLYSPWEVVSHLRCKGRTSEWHRNVFLNLPWTDADDSLAREGGWKLAGSLQPQIVRTSQKYDSDEAAAAAVAAQASGSTPDPLCVKALTYLAKRRLLEGVQI